LQTHVQSHRSFPPATPAVTSNRIRAGQFSPRAAGHHRHTAPTPEGSDAGATTAASAADAAVVGSSRQPSISKHLRHYAGVRPGDAVVHVASSEPTPQRALSARALVAGGCWIACSSAIILLNKKVLSHYSFTAVNTLLAYHCVIAVVLLRGAERVGLVEIVPLNREILVLWLPLNFIFVAMLATAFKALGLVSGSCCAGAGWVAAVLRGQQGLCSAMRLVLMLFWSLPSYSFNALLFRTLSLAAGCWCDVIA